MTLYEATLERHSVRAYQDKPLDAGVVKTLTEKINEINSATGLHVQLVTNEPTAFKSPLARYGLFSNVSSYLVMVGQRNASAEELIGYHGEELVLTAQTMGVNSCWVGLTYKLKADAVTIGKGEKVHCVIALGYGADQGRQHKTREPKEVSNVSDLTPKWFLSGVTCALNAPTAVNQQKFYFELQPDQKTVKATTKRSLVGYTHVDLGIAKRHFELGIEEAERQCGQKLPFKWML